ncbi:hypothetical protein F5Y14DRAFT_118550 [Nemania sp. NC0429]|nr:hypothetical protein F5Y14DRAFT_118550 [Nemania sp. NC0429]
MPSTCRVLLLSLNQQPNFDLFYTPLLFELGMWAYLERTSLASTAMRVLLTQPPPFAIIITDDALTLDKNADV